jgi:hypothetical protein
VHRSRIQSARSALTESVSIHKLRRDNIRFLCRKWKATTAGCAQSSQELKSCVKMCCKSIQVWDSTKSRSGSIKKSKNQEQRNTRIAGKDSFQESLDLRLMTSSEKQEVLGRLKYMRRSSSGGIVLSKGV